MKVAGISQNSQQKVRNNFHPLINLFDSNKFALLFSQEINPIELIFSGIFRSSELNGKFVAGNEPQTVLGFRH